MEGILEGMEICPHRYGATFLWCYRVEEHYKLKALLHRGQQTAKNTLWVIQVWPILRSSKHRSLPSACLQHWFPGSKQPNAPARSWRGLIQAVRKSWIFHVWRLNPPQASPFSYAHTCSSLHAKRTDMDILALKIHCAFQFLFQNTQALN